MVMYYLFKNDNFILSLGRLKHQLIHVWYPYDLDEYLSEIIQLLSEYANSSIFMRQHYYINYEFLKQRDTFYEKLGFIKTIMIIVLRLTVQIIVSQP